MAVRKFFAVILCVFSLSACVSAQNNIDRAREVAQPSRGLPSAFALPGTTTAVVGIGVDKKGIPLETVKEIVLKPGQKVVFAGPDRFQIKFKKDKTPAGIVKFESESGVITVVVPKDIFEKPEFARELKEKQYVRFDYSIYVNGRELDPPLIVRKDD